MELIVSVLSVVLSAWFAGAETVFLSFDKVLLPVWVKRGRRGAQRLTFFTSKPERFLVTTLAGNTLVNVLYASMFALWLTDLGISGKIIFVLAPLNLLIFGETVPKAIARQVADRVAPMVGYILSIFRILFYPVSGLLEYLVAALRERLGLSGMAMQRALSRSDIAQAVMEAGQEGIFSPESVSIARRALGISRKRVSDIMTPRVSTISLPLNTPLDETRQAIMNSGFSRLPCYETSPDDVQGVILALDLLKNPQELKSIIRPLPMVPESLSVARLMRWFREQETRFAGVVDEYGGFAGVVSHEDLVEELVGPIEDEYDRQGHGCYRLSDGVWLVEGRTRLSHVEQVTGVKTSETRTGSVGGLITQISEGIPQPGAAFDLKGCTLQVIRADSRGVKLVRMTRKIEAEATVPRRSR